MIDGNNYAAPGHMTPLPDRGVFGSGWPVDPCEAFLAAIEKELPPGFHPELTVAERVRALVLELEQMGMGLCAHMAELQSLRQTVEELREVKRNREEREKFVVKLLGGG